MNQAADNPAGAYAGDKYSISFLLCMRVTTAWLFPTCDIKGVFFFCETHSRFALHCTGLHGTCRDVRVSQPPVTLRSLVCQAGNK